MNGVPVNLRVRFTPPAYSLVFAVKEEIQQVTQRQLLPDASRRRVELNGLLGVATKVQCCQKPLGTLPFGMNGAYTSQEAQCLLVFAGLHETDRPPPCGVV